MREENWKGVWTQPCRAKKTRTSDRQLAADQNASHKVPKTIYVCKVESHESTRQREWNLLYLKIHEGHIAGNGFTSMTQYNLVHKLILMPRAIKIPDVKAAVDGERQELEGGYSRSTKRQKESHFDTLMDMCHSKNAELEPKLQKYEGRAVLRGDIVKDHSDIESVACPSQSGSLALTSITFAAVICDSDEPCSVKTAWAPEYTQVKLEDTPRLLRIPMSECPDVWVRLPRHKWPKWGSNIEDPVVHLERNLYEDPLAGLLWGKTQFEEVLLELGWEEVPNWKCLFVHRKQELFLSFKCGWHQNGWKEAECGSNVDLDEPTSFLDHEKLGCTQRECKPNEIIIEENTKMFESRISAGATEKLPGWEKNITQRRLRGPTTWKDMLENSWKEIGNWRRKRQSS